MTDTRYSNVVFGDGSSWVTPETFLLPGTKRAFLLSRGDIRECSVRAEDIGKFRFCSLINAMLDPGDVVVRTLTASTATVTYSAAVQTTDFGVAQSVLSIAVYQMNSTIGRGYPGKATV